MIKIKDSVSINIISSGPKPPAKRFKKIINKLRRFLGLSKGSVKIINEM
jgi:hypothetical protein